MSFRSFKAIDAALWKLGYIAILLHIDDIREVRPDLTKAQARRALRRCKAQHDAGHFFDFDLVEFHADAMFPVKKEGA